jgi:hypothetical protein
VVVVKLPGLSERGPVKARHDAFVADQVDALRALASRKVDVTDAATTIPIVRPTLANDKVHDGAILGADGIFSALTRADAVKPVLPDNGAPVREHVILVNGIMTDIELQRADMQGLANTGAAVVGVHNATEGMTKDLLECVLNKLDRGDTPAIDTLARVVARSLEDDRPVHLIGHSQGALIVARALQIVTDALRESGLTDRETKGVLARITVETYGGASQSYVDGPKYTHVVNKADAIPMLTGVGLDAFNPWGSVGEAAHVKTFVEAHVPKDLPSVRENGVTWTAARAVDQAVHGPRDVYWKHRKP